ncbi:MAG TPA: peptidylprolyl isomerase [Urbifossiella sp.]|nr:peptidylprolyl isomerase [Urbifossiella sp.]
MRRFTRVAAAMMLGGAVTAASAQTPSPPAAPPAAPPATPTVPPLTPPPSLTPPPPGLATPTPPKPEPRPVGDAAIVTTTLGGAPVTSKIPEVSVYRGLRQFPPANRDLARKEIVNQLVENILVEQYLAAIKVTVEPKEVEQVIGELQKELKAMKKDFSKELAAMMLTEEEFRAEVQAQLKWESFVKKQSTDAALQQLFASSPDIFDGSMVRARHILFTPGSDKAKQEEAAGKLRGIKQAIDQEAAKAVAAAPATADAAAKDAIRDKKVDELFAAFATRDSQCPSKKDGGDLNFFPRAGAMVEPFAKVAFELKPYQMSDVVVTEFGYHLILVTARKPGKPKKFEDVKEDVKLLYAMKLREAVIAQVKPKAKIEILPAPQTAAAPATPATPPSVPTVPVGTGAPKP